MSQHTPGPWKAREYVNKDGDVWIDCDSWKNPKTRSCRGGTLATAHKNGTGEGDVFANARLIARAPALRDLLARYMDTCVHGPETRRALNAEARALLKEIDG